MLIKTPLFNWKNVFDKTKEEFKVGYDFMCSTDIRILENNFSRYKTDYYVDLFFNGGVIVLELNMQEYRIDSPANFLVQPGDELRILSHDSDLSVFIIVASKSIRDDFLGNFDKNNSVHRAIKAKHLYLVSKKDRIDVDDFINDILKLVKDVDNPFRFDAIKWSITIVILINYTHLLGFLAMMSLNGFLSCWICISEMRENHRFIPNDFLYLLVISNIFSKQ